MTSLLKSLKFSVFVVMLVVTGLFVFATDTSIVFAAGGPVVLMNIDAKITMAPLGAATVARYLTHR